MSVERNGWEYRGRVALVGLTSGGVDRILVDVDLRIEVERGGPGSLVTLRSWCGTATVPDEYRELFAKYQGVGPVERFTLVLPDGQEGQARVYAGFDDGALSLEVQGVGVPPWLAA